MYVFVCVYTDTRIYSLNEYSCYALLVVARRQLMLTYGIYADVCWRMLLRAPRRGASAGSPR